MPRPNPCPKEEHQFIADWQYPEHSCDSWIINDDYFGYLPKETHSLILGTFPVPLTKDADFFYHSDRSQFWMLLGKVAGVAFETIEDRLKWLDEKKIGITDIVRVAQRTDQNCSSASDKKLKVLRFNNICQILREYPKIRQVFLTSGGPLSRSFSGSSAGGFLGQALRKCLDTSGIKRYNENISSISFQFENREIRLFYLYTPSNNNQQLRMRINQIPAEDINAIQNIFHFDDPANNYKALQWCWCFKHANGVVDNAILNNGIIDEHINQLFNTKN